ncbi:MAG TPA: hypothetical protein PKH60_02680 [Candidatus Woesebacteria bacterium]|nr:hypothetical protein [Candidatus Woesebacteria bacterium]
MHKFKDILHATTDKLIYNIAERHPKVVRMLIVGMLASLPAMAILSACDDGGTQTYDTSPGITNTIKGSQGETLQFTNPVPPPQDEYQFSNEPANGLLTGP